MKSALLLTLLSACSGITTTNALRLEKCSYRIANMQHVEDSFELAVFDCDFDEDLYLKSRIDADLPPIPSTASKENVTAIISESATVSAIHWANFAGLSITDGSAVSNSVFSYSHNVKLSCQHEDIGFEFFQKPSHNPPADFLYSLPPMKNSLNELWQAFGAYKWPEDPVPRRMSFALMLNAGPESIAPEHLDTCIDNGKLIVSTDTSPLEACPECNFVQTDSGCSEEECSIWQYSDGLGNLVDPLSSVVVEYADNQCDIQTFKNFTSDRLPQLYDLLESSKTDEESQAAMLSYTTIVNNIDYAACLNVFDSLYTTTAATVFLQGVRGCVDPTNEMDPCCNEAAQWSDCCIPEDKYIEIEGVYNSSNPEAIEAMCGANSAGVKNLLDSSISEVLISASHPEFGCNAAYEKIVPSNGKNSVYQTLWEESSVSKCEEEVRWGKSVVGEDSCSANEECWSGSCVSSGGSQKRCAQLYGEAIVGPLLSCLVSRVDKKVWKYMGAVLDIDPSKVKKGSDFKGPIWQDAVEKFKKLVGSPNCVGESAEQGICAIIDITKDECISIHHKWEWDRQMEWVVDETNVNGGFCKKQHSNWYDSSTDSWFHIHRHTENVQEECEAMISSMQGACTNLNGLEYFKPESECTGEGESWFAFESRAVGGYRLVSKKIYMLEETTGNWIESIVDGDEDKCMLQSTCNWDPENRITQGDEDLCLDPSPLETTTYPRASFEEDGKAMTCLQCWGSRCEDFWSASPPICAVRPQHHDDCAENSGGGPANDSPVSPMMSLEGEDSHMKCRRNDLKTESECLPSDLCPLPSLEANPWDDWLWHCAESGCWDLSKTEDSCLYDDTTGLSSGWRSEWNAGEGACRVEYDHNEGKGFEEKSHCESKGFMWWEGRAFKPGKWNSAEECTTFCNDGTWPLQKTCSSGSCNEQCAQCVEGNSWQFPDGAACYLTSEVGQNDCFSLSEYEWDWTTKLCYRKDFTGTEADCIAFDQSGSGGDVFSMSMSMTSDFNFSETPTQDSLAHEYVSCPAQSEGTCSAYCWAKDYDDYMSCQNEDLEWDWSTSRCKHYTWMVNQDSSPTCESYVSGFDKNSSEHDRWQNAEKCWSNGCHFEVGNVGSSAPTCSGKAKGCAQQEGNNQWVNGGDESTSAAKILLGCRWDMWRSCPTEETCVNAGECDDWFMGNQGKCIVPLEPNDWGHRKGCHEVKHPIDGTTYDWADKLGCVARKTEDGTATYVKEAECGSIGGTWHVRANSRETCEGDRGNVCTHPFDEWRVYGGIETEEKCDTCGYKTTPPTKWRQGIWSTSAETPLYWVERAFSAKNTWEENSFDESAFHALVRNTISRYVADAYKNKVYCELGAYNAFIPAIISMCSADGDIEQNIVEYDLTTSKVSCGDLQDMPPMETYEGSISYGNAECTNKEDKFAETTMGKVVPLASELGSRRRAMSSSVCYQHEIIKNSNNAIVGQKLGSGLSVTNVDGATVCVKPSVPEHEICSNYTEFGISTVDSNSGSYSVPLSTSTSINQQGEICFDESESGVAYVPVKLMSGWETVSGIATQAPTTSTTQVPSTSPSNSPSEFPTVEVVRQTTEAPTVDSASPMPGRGIVMSVMRALPLAISFFGMMH